jgi:threonine dehydrogenase-like Zn-dependent dehydrogenase
MLAVRKTAPRPGVSLDEVAEPGPPGPDEVLVEVAAAGICGSDVHVYEWSGGYEFLLNHLPLTLGHELSGRVAARGPGVSGLAEGDLVTVAPTTTCMRCGACSGGHPELCTTRRTLGLTAPGAFAPLVRVPAVSCFLAGARADPAVAALTEPLCVGDNAAEVGGIGPGDGVVVLGPGTIGQAVVVAALARGAARVVVVGKDDAPRLAVAARLGATATVDLAGRDLASAAEELLPGGRADVVVEATGHPPSLAAGLSILRRGGVLVVAGIYAEAASLDATAFVRNRQQLRAAHGSTRRAWERMVEFTRDHPERVRPMISRQLSLRDAVEGFEACRSRSVSKVLLVPGPATLNANQGGA